MFVLKLLGNQQIIVHELGDPCLCSEGHMGIGCTYSSCSSTKLAGAWYLGCVTVGDCPSRSWNIPVSVSILVMS